MVILVEGKTPNDQATRGDLDTWIRAGKIPFTATLDSVDPQPAMETYFNVPRDQSLVIDLASMTLIEVVDANAQQAISDVEAMLPGDMGTPGG